MWRQNNLFALWQYLEGLRYFKFINHIIGNGNLELLQNISLHFQPSTTWKTIRAFAKNHSRQPVWVTLQAVGETQNHFPSRLSVGYAWNALRFNSFKCCVVFDWKTNFKQLLGNSINLEKSFFSEEKKTCCQHLPLLVFGLIATFAIIAFQVLILERYRSKNVATESGL